MITETEFKKKTRWYNLRNGCNKFINGDCVAVILKQYDNKKIELIPIKQIITALKKSIKEIYIVLIIYLSLFIILYIGGGFV